MSWHVSGTVKQGGLAATRTIRALLAADGTLQATGSSPGGTFDFPVPTGGPVYLLFEPAAGYQPIVRGPVTPAEV